MKTNLSLLFLLLIYFFSSYSFSVIAGSRSTLPKTPTNVLAVGSDEVIKLNWSNVEDASSYKIYRAYMHQGKPTFRSLIRVSQSNLFFDTILQNGRVYYYWIRSCNSRGCSKDSKIAMATPSIKRTYSHSYTLNDTGITVAGHYAGGNSSNCFTGTVTSLQDCEQGRDSQSNFRKIGGGSGGFDFTKLGANGKVLAIQNRQWDNNGNEKDGTKWSCVQDNHTKLIWEVKTIDKSPHDRSNRYRWGGKTSIGIEESTRKGDYYNDWDSLVDHANSRTAPLCGYSFWRLPTRGELQTIVDMTFVDLVYSTRPAIDTDYFPNTQASDYWSASASPHADYVSWFVPFGEHFKANARRDSLRYVRLVRMGN